MSKTKAHATHSFYGTTDSAPDWGLHLPKRLDGSQQSQTLVAGALPCHCLQPPFFPDWFRPGCGRDPVDTLPDRSLSPDAIRRLGEELDGGPVLPLGGMSRNGIPQQFTCL